VVVCLERGADLHIAQLMPMPLTVSFFSKIQIGFTFLVPAHPGSPGKRAVKRVCVRVCVRACVWGGGAGSSEELAALRSAYTRYEGDMERVVMTCGTSCGTSGATDSGDELRCCSLDDVDRLCSMLESLLSAGQQTPRYKAFCRSAAEMRRRAAAASRQMQQQQQVRRQQPPTHTHTHSAAADLLCFSIRLTSVIHLCSRFS